MYNPDAPTEIGSFLQHTYQQPTQNPMDSSFYYNDGSTNPFDTYGQLQSDSRRNIMANNNMCNMNNTNLYGMNTYGMNNGYNTQMQQPVVEQPIMPFSTYPSGMPNQQQQLQPAFNSLVDSRRNATAVNNNANTTNPWATTNQQPMQPAQGYQMNQAQQPMQYNNQMYYSNMQPACSSLYGNSINNFNKKDAYWDNQYTNPQYLMTPNVNWNASTNLNPMGNMNTQQQQYQQPQQMYGNMAQYPKTNMSWVEIVEKNWSNI